MQLPKTYEPNLYETDIYAMWETTGAFKPTGEGEPYSIVMPPPNANANLHVGHSSEIIKDILIRYQRMNGRDTIYIPGADHAGFETWVVFEKALKEEGKSRFDFSREQLYQMTWDFVAKNRGNMELQLRALGTSCDWSTNTFTLDKKVVDTVYSTFKKMWNDGLIYRGQRPVNYCTYHQTGFADIEVSYEDETTPLYYIKYGPFELATTRPETKFGDTAVAVHPDDKRYTEWVGKTVTIPGVIGDFQVEVVADEMVDPNFGTGVVKVTPAHSFDDWEVAQRHNLTAVRVIDPDGKLNDKTGRFAGMTILDGRKAVVEAMQEMGLILKIDEKYKTRIGRCYKCGTMIEPMLMKQWFINIRPLADRAKKIVAEGKIKFTPAQKAQELIHYYDEMRDWNISRQIPWGIPIPAFQNVDDSNDWIFDTRVDQSEIEVEGHKYRRDNDTFDTWFSSGQWPYATTDFLDKGALKRFYPTSLMENGTDLLRPWDARMIMLGLYRTDQVPFKEIYLHGMVTDEKGRKMSKSKGNVVNPMDFVAEFGSDALRVGITMNRAAGQNQAFSKATVIAGRNFCNKLWNVARLVQKITDENPDAKEVVNDPAAHWIKRQLNKAEAEISDHIRNYRFGEAVDTMYHVIWDDVADWFMEAEKLTKNVSVLNEVMDYVLKIAHPFAPFVTEAIWTTFHNDGSLLISQQWVTDFHYNDDKAEMFDSIRSLVNEIRRITTQLPAKKYDLLHVGDEIIVNNVDLITTLADLGSIQRFTGGRGLRIPSTDREAWLDLSPELIHDYQTKLEKRLVETRADIKKLESRLDNQGYLDRAPTHLIEESCKDLADKRELVEQLIKELEAIK